MQQRDQVRPPFSIFYVLLALGKQSVHRSSKVKGVLIRMYVVSMSAGPLKLSCCAVTVCKAANTVLAVATEEEIEKEEEEVGCSCYAQSHLQSYGLLRSQASVPWNAGRHKIGL